MRLPLAATRSRGRVLHVLRQIFGLVPFLLSPPISVPGAREIPGLCGVLFRLSSCLSKTGGAAQLADSSNSRCVTADFSLGSRLFPVCLERLY